MSNTASASKRVRQSGKQRLRNRARKSRVKTALKDLEAVIHQGNKQEAVKLQPQVQKIIDQAVAAGVYKKNTAARLKSQMMQHVNALP